VSSSAGAAPRPRPGRPGRIMITEDQREVREFLASPSTNGGEDVEPIETHASVVFLAGTRALTRAVRYDYLDFSTAERRRAMCEAEVRVNRRTALTSSFSRSRFDLPRLPTYWARPVAWDVLPS
jgi:hypothetical protein